MRTFLLGVLLYIVGLMLCVSLLFAQQQEARMSLGVIGGGVAAAPAGDSCTGGLVFSAHFENNDDVTTVVSGATGCSANDTTVALTNATYSTTQKYDGSYALYCDGQDYASVSVTDLIDPSNAATKGKVTFWVYIDTFITATRLFNIAGTTDTGNNILRITMTGDNTNIEFQITFEGNNVNQNCITGDVNGVEDTWYYVVGIWDIADVNPNLKLNIYSDEGITEVGTGCVDNDNLTAFVDNGSVFAIGNQSVAAGVTYIDKFKLYNTY